MSETAIFLTVAAAAGVAGSLHCAAMCGGIASLGTARRGAAPRPLAAAALFHGARIASYAALGAVLATGAGRLSERLPGAFETAGRLLAAALMAALALRILANRDLFGLERLGARLFRGAAPLWSVLVGIRGPARQAALGMLWGFMPCGLVYSMLAVAGATGRPLLGATAMALFGLGTVPALIGFTLGGAALAPALSGERVRVLAGVLVLIGALWTGVGGLTHRLHGHLDHPEGAVHEPPAASPSSTATAAPPGTVRMPVQVWFRFRP